MMKHTNKLTLPAGRAICYSGYRDGQNPGQQLYPSHDEILQDLRLLQEHWQLLRLYDCSLHAERVLEVIATEGLPFQVLLGAYLGAEINNPGCPWGASYSDEQLQGQRQENDAEVGRLIDLAGRYPQQVFAVAVGNECTVSWSDHLVPLPRMLEQVRRVKQGVHQPVTFCENHVPWVHDLRELAQALDFISVHTYPLWEYHGVETAMAVTRADMARVHAAHPDKPVIITEAGWTTRSNGRGMHLAHVSPEAQQVYLRELLEWADTEGVLTFVFEAFDEAWKGSPDPLEPEKHWGIYQADRAPKLFMQQGVPPRRGATLRTTA